MGMYRWVRYRRLASPTAMHKRYQPWLYNSCVKKLVIHKWLNGDSRHENIAMLTTPWGEYRIHRHAIQPKCKCDQELFRDLNPILGWISVYTQHWSISPTHSYGNTKDEELCVKKTGDHEHTKDLKKKRTKEQKNNINQLGPCPPPKKWVEHRISLKPPISYLTPRSHSRHLPHQRQCFYDLVDWNSPFTHRMVTPSSACWFKIPSRYNYKYHTRLSIVIIVINQLS